MECSGKHTIDSHLSYYATTPILTSFARNFKAYFSYQDYFALKKVKAMNLTVEVFSMETASIAVTGEFYPKINKTACSNAQMLALTETRGYSAIASCVVEHIITNDELKESERLYYVLADLYANYERAKNGIRSVTKPGAVWGKCLNSREEYVFVLQKSLEKKGYFHIQRNRFDNQNDINIITPTLPSSVFQILKLSEDRKTPSTQIAAETESRGYLDDTKMFVKFNNTQITRLVQNEALTPLQKLIWLLFYMRSNFSYQAAGDWRSTITQGEICQLFKCSQSSASKALNNLEKHGFIVKSQCRLVDTKSRSNRHQKSIWFIDALFPIDVMSSLFKQKARTKTANYDSEYMAELDNIVDNFNNIPTVKGEYSHGSDEYSQRSADYSQNSVSSIRSLTSDTLSNKNIKHQNYMSLDVTDVFFEKEQISVEASANRASNDKSILSLDIVHEKFQRNLTKLTPQQALKAKNYAKKLVREKSCSEDLHDVDEQELARQFIHHAANYKMTRLSCKTRDEEVEAALNFAWKAAKTGRWRCPAGWGEAIDLHLEREKYLYEYQDAPEVSKFERKVKRYLNS